VQNQQKKKIYGKDGVLVSQLAFLLN